MRVNLFLICIVQVTRRVLWKFWDIASVSGDPDNIGYIAALLPIFTAQQNLDRADEDYHKMHERSEYVYENVILIFS